jgi:hypothetical protein
MIVWDQFWNATHGRESSFPELATRSACRLVRAMLNTIDTVAGVLLAIAIYSAVSWIGIFFVPAALSTFLPNPTARLKAAFAKVEAMYGEDKETYHIALGFGAFAIVTGIAMVLAMLAFGREATGSGRFKISGACQRVYAFFSYLGTNPVFAGVGTFVTGIGLVCAACAGCGRWLRSIRGIVEKVYRQE